jgi:AbrB family looped-hinge helix DNA binding protein
MPLVKLKQKGQLTLPASIRQQLGLSEGAVLEADVENGRIILIPKMVIDRQEAFKEMWAIAAEARKRWEAEGKTEEDMERLINETVEEVRAERYAKRRANS